MKINTFLNLKIQDVVYYLHMNGHDQLRIVSFRKTITLLEHPDNVTLLDVLTQKQFEIDIDMLLSLAITIDIKEVIAHHYNIINRLTGSLQINPG